MTMPHLMNCDHSDDGWCLDCVKKLWEDFETANSECERMREERDKLPSAGSLDAALIQRMKTCAGMCKQMAATDFSPARRQWFSGKADGFREAAEEIKKLQRERREDLGL